MDINQFLTYLESYGLTIMFIVVMLEYLNLPGLPAGVIMPATGIIIAKGEHNFLLALVISVIAGTIGSFILYLIGYYGGNPILDKFSSKYKRMGKAIEKINKINDKYGSKYNFIARLIPMARTLVSLTSGILRYNPIKFLLYSIPGIAIWNFAFIYAGYAFSNSFI